MGREIRCDTFKSPAPSISPEGGGNLEEFCGGEIQFKFCGKVQNTIVPL